MKPRLFKYLSFAVYSKLSVVPSRSVQHSSLLYNHNEDKQIVKLRSYFQTSERKSEDTFLEAVKVYTNRPGPRRGHVEFIYAALKHMEEFGAHKNLQAYKDLIDILPKGQYIPTNMFQAEFMHYPKQQQCIIDVLEQMEENGVIPDKETEQMLLNIFGRHGHPVKKLMRMLYWMPKFKNLSPWALPEKLPNSTIELAKLAIARMGSVDPATELDIFSTKELQDSIDDTWIVSGQSPDQRELLSKLEDKQTVYVEGAFTLWLRKTSINYFVLRAEPKKDFRHIDGRFEAADPDDVRQFDPALLADEPQVRNILALRPTVHEQEDGIILATGITGTSSRDSLLSWVRFLEKKNPHLSNLSVLFAAKSPLGEIVPVSDQVKLPERN